MAAEEIRHRSSDALDHIQIAEEKVLVGSKFIKVDNSPRPDQVDPKTLWGKWKGKIRGFAVIIASSSATGEVREDWRVADIIP